MRVFLKMESTARVLFRGQVAHESTDAKVPKGTYEENFKLGFLWERVAF